MPGAEVKNPPGAARPAAAAAENFAAAEAADQDRLLRLGDVEEFAVHLLSIEDARRCEGREVVAREHSQDAIRSVKACG